MIVETLEIGNVLNPNVCLYCSITVLVERTDLSLAVCDFSSSDKADFIPFKGDRFCEIIKKNGEFRLHLTQMLKVYVFVVKCVLKRLPSSKIHNNGAFGASMLCLT